MNQFMKKVVAVDFNKINGKRETVLVKTGRMTQKDKWVNNERTDQKEYVASFIIMTGELVGCEFDVKFEQDFSHIMSPMSAVEIDFDEERCNLWVKDGRFVTLSLRGKSLKMKVDSRSGNTGV